MSLYESFVCIDATKEEVVNNEHPTIHARKNGIIMENTRTRFCRLNAINTRDAQMNKANPINPPTLSTGFVMFKDNTYNNENKRVINNNVRDTGPPTNRLITPPGSDVINAPNETIAQNKEMMELMVFDFSSSALSLLKNANSPAINKIGTNT